MADQAQVKAETQDAGTIEPAVIVGHSVVTGEFLVQAAAGVHPLAALALLEHARNVVLAQINPNKPRQVVPASRIVPMSGRRPH